MIKLLATNYNFISTRLMSDVQLLLAFVAKHNEVMISTPINAVAEKCGRRKNAFYTCHFRTLHVKFDVNTTHCGNFM